jgi:hypothetical protein
MRLTSAALSAAIAALCTISPVAARDGDDRRQRGRYRIDDRYRERGTYGYGQPGIYRGASPLNQVLRDLSTVSAARADSHERNHLRRARERLLEFQEEARKGKFDRGELDKAIEDLQHLADSDQFSRRDHQIFVRDLALLRDFRASRGAGYGYRW